MRIDLEVEKYIFENEWRMKRLLEWSFCVRYKILILEINMD